MSDIDVSSKKIDGLSATNERPDSSKRELLKKAWVAPVVVTLATLPLGKAEAGTAMSTTTLSPG